MVNYWKTLIHYFYKLFFWKKLRKTKNRAPNLLIIKRIPDSLQRSKTQNFLKPCSIRAVLTLVERRFKWLKVAF